MKKQKSHELEFLKKALKHEELMDKEVEKFIVEILRKRREEGRFNGSRQFDKNQHKYFKEKNEWKNTIRGSQGA